MGITTLVIATRNVHKAQEIRQILGPDFRYLTLRDFAGAPEVIEDASTFEGNAQKKVWSLARWLEEHPADLPTTTSCYIVADDSGLEVDALEGAPGVLSARFAADEVRVAGNAPDTANNAKLLRLLAGQPAAGKAARFRCVLAVARLGLSAEQPVFFEGVCEGRINDNPAGEDGFGYDPLFVPAGRTQSFAQLGAEEKNKFSHRARALGKLNAWIKTSPPP
ncbi:MAG TPA: non-canonical purine NTP pyrophosphatase [Candidatus Saccharimonadales bacterium]|nr:non-canonical purine NTP pyrophosphatase [Candidatus Saccharimonadales bacterium]